MNILFISNFCYFRLCSNKRSCIHFLLHMQTFLSGMWLRVELLGHRTHESPTLHYQMALQSPIAICTPLSRVWDHLLLHTLMFVDAVGASHRSPLLAGTPLVQLLCMFLLMAPRCLLAGALPLAMGVSHLVYSRPRVSLYSFLFFELGPKIRN